MWIIVAGEGAFRRGLREEVERLEEARKLEEKMRLERLAAMEAQRLADLRRSGELLREANDIRALVETVKAAVVAGEQPIDADALVEWEIWALAYADRVDPVRSGQIQSHLKAPTIS
jgi:L-fucose isomerase-like protein